MWEVGARAPAAAAARPSTGTWNMAACAVVRLVALLVLAAQPHPLVDVIPPLACCARRAQQPWLRRRKPKCLALNLAPTPAEAAVQRLFDVVTASPAPLSDIEEGEERRVTLTTSLRCLH